MGLCHLMGLLWVYYGLDMGLYDENGMILGLYNDGLKWDINMGLHWDVDGDTLW